MMGSSGLTTARPSHYTHRVAWGAPSPTGDALRTRARGQQRHDADGDSVTRGRFRDGVVAAPNRAAHLDVVKQPSQPVIDLVFLHPAPPVTGPCIACTASPWLSGATGLLAFRGRKHRLGGGVVDSRGGRPPSPAVRSDARRPGWATPDQLAARRSDAVAAAQGAAAADTARATSGRTSVLHLAHVVAIADGFEPIADRGVAAAIGPTRTTGGSFRARGNELAESSQRSELHIDQLATRFVLA